MWGLHKKMLQQQVLLWVFRAERIKTRPKMNKLFQFNCCAWCATTVVFQTAMLKGSLVLPLSSTQSILCFQLGLVCYCFSPVFLKNRKDNRNKRSVDVVATQWRRTFIRSYFIRSHPSRGNKNRICAFTSSPLRCSLLTRPQMQFYFGAPHWHVCSFRALHVF